MAPRVSRCRDCNQIGVQPNWFQAGYDLLDTETGRAVESMHYARAAEPAGEFGVIGNVVLMSEEHQAKSALRGYCVCEMGVISRRVDEYVPSTLGRANNQVAPGAEARL